MRAISRWVAAAVAAFGALCAPMPAMAQHAPPQQQPQVVATADARRADIAAFREHFLSLDKSYSEAARAEAEARLTALERSAENVSQAYFELEIARIVALADNGHTAFFPGPRSRRYNRVDIRFAPFGEDYYVLRATEATADLLGARLVSVDGHGMDDLRRLARSLMGGAPAWRDRNAGYLFESPEQLAALLHDGESAAPASAVYRFLTAEGRRVTVRLDARPADPNRPRANADRWYYPQLMAEEGEAWRALLSVSQAPWALQDPDNPFRWRAAPELDGMVIELRQNNDGPQRTIADALAEFDAALVDIHPHNLVLDMRMNGGGDLNTTRDFIQRLPQRVPGRIFVLTSPWTFSAGISSVGYLKQAAPDRVSIVGEAVGDRLNFFAEGDIVTLPNAQIMLLYAHERHDYQTGCRGYSDCHGPVVRNPISVATLAPEISAPWTFEAYRAGRDPAMEAVQAALR